MRENAPSGRRARGRAPAGPARCGPVCVLLLVAVAAGSGLVPAATAHAGFTGGEVTEFAMPAWVVYFAGALVVALSFALVAAFLSREEEQRRIHRDTDAPPKEPVPDTRLTPLRAFSLLVLAVLVLHAVLPASPHLPAVMFWIVLWVVLPFIAYTLGDVWSRLSPFAPLLPVAVAVRGGAPPRPYPARLGMWPSVVLLVALIALEVGTVGWTVQPRPLALIALGYLVFTLLGMAVFGAPWLAHAEVIGRMLRWWSAVSPFAWDGLRPRWRGLRGLERFPMARMDAVAFTIALLYGVNHDVLLHTTPGQAAVARLAAWGVPLPEGALLVAGLLVFLVAWLLAARAMRDQGESLATVRMTAAAFAASLLPIAAAYHLAHNIPYLWQSLPVLQAAVVGPLGAAAATADPAGLAQAFPSRFLGALAAAQVILILAGHLVAVLVAHRLAFVRHPSRVQAVRAEVPLTLAMVFYTGVSLALLGTKGGAV